jgi:plastocyanin
MMSIACSEMATPVSPSPISIVDTSAEVPASSESPSETAPVITMLSDYTASPSYVKVKVGYRVTFVNHSGRYFQIHSSNCSQFTMVDPSPGSSVRSGIFKYAGKVCNFYAWDTNWSRKLFEGKVEVVP